MMTIPKLIRFIKYYRSRPRIRVASAWDSMAVAASEEMGGGQDFKFVIPDKTKASYEKLVSRILEIAVTENPDLNDARKVLSSAFAISIEESLTAIDRTLGGVARASSMNPQLCPDMNTDPIACIAFEMAMQRPETIDVTYPFWRQWHLDDPPLPKNPDSRDGDQA